MKRPQQILTILGIAFFVFAIYPTCIQGKTDGPDFLEGARTGKINADSIASIQVIIQPTSNLCLISSNRQIKAPANECFHKPTTLSHSD